MTEAAAASAADLRRGGPKRWLGRAWQDPVLALGHAAVALFLLGFVVAPLVAVAFAPGLADWARVASTPRWRDAGLNTLLLVGLSTTSSLVLGTLYAYAVTRARVPLRRLFEVAPLVLLVTPSFVSGLAFILLVGRRGLITYHLLGLETSVYGWHGVWLAQTLSFFPVAYLVLRGVFLAHDAALEQAARGLGASRWRVISTVTLPLATPGLLAAGLFIAIGVLGDFGNPMLVGGRFRVLATEVYTELTGWASVGTSAALGLVLLVPAVLLFVAQQRVQHATAGRFTTVGGRGSGLPAPLPPAALRWALFALCGLVALFVAASQGVVVAGSLTRLWGVDHALTAEHYQYVLTRSRPLVNSVRLAATAALLCAAVSSVTAYLVLRTRVPLRRGLDLATLLPAAVPGTLMGVAYVLVFNRPPLQLTGTAALIAIAMAASYLPVGYRICAAALQQLRASLDESAANLGASRARAFLTVTVPLTWPAVAAAFAYTFVQAVGTLSTVIFLVSFDTPLASVDILNLAAQGKWGRACALATALLVVTLAALGLAYALTGGRLRPLEAAAGPVRS